MEDILNVISQPIPSFTKELDYADKELILAFCAYLVTYAHICRQKNITDDDKRALLSACETLKRIPSTTKVLKEVIAAINVTEGRDEFDMYGEYTMFEDDPIEPFQYILGSDEKEEILQSAGQKFTNIAAYIDTQLKKYRVNAILAYEHGMGEVEHFSISLNVDETFDAKLDDIGDITILLEVALDIIDYTDYEIVVNNDKGEPDLYEGFEDRINTKKKIKAELEKCVKLFEADKDDEVPKHLMNAFNDLDYLISPENKGTCIRKLINLARSVNAGDKKAIKTTNGDYKKYVTLYDE